MGVLHAVGLCFPGACTSFIAGSANGKKMPLKTNNEKPEKEICSRHGSPEGRYSLCCASDLHVPVEVVRQADPQVTEFGPEWVRFRGILELSVFVKQ